MLFMGLVGIALGLGLVFLSGDSPGIVFLAGVNVGWGLLLTLIALINYHAEYKRDQWWKRDG